MMLHEEQKLIITDQMESKPEPIFSMNGHRMIVGDNENVGGSTTDRSSASPSNDDLMEDDGENHVGKVVEDDHSGDDIEQRIEHIETKFVYVQHQLSRIMKHLHVTPCACESCSDVHRSVEGARQLDDPTQMLAQLFPNASSAQLKTLLDLSKMNKLPSQVVPQQNKEERQSSQPAQPQQQSTAANAVVQKLGTAYSGTNGGGKVMAEKPIETRKAISEYAKNHGAAQAAKKFGFPPPVSTYYHRKDSNNSLPSTPLVSIPSSTNVFPTSNSATASPGPSSDGGDDHIDILNQAHEMEKAVQRNGMGSISVPTTPNMSSQMFPQSMVDILKMNSNAAHSTGSPGFLRGRGRGRPKLIGDELDADLVDYMVQVKQTDPHCHLTASQALHIAKQYILERAPGLLEEHGGHVKLKLTWAMKLVTRIAERQKEIEYGLPAGSLSNMGRSLSTLPGGNFMADMMAHNILSQHMMMVNNIGDKSAQKNQEFNGKVEQPSNPVTIQSVPSSLQKENDTKPFDATKISAQIPEIVNIKELNIPFLTNFLAEFNEKNGHVKIDGEITADI